MAKYVYPAIFQKAEEGGYCIDFPDVSGCGTQGENLVDGMDMASDALALTLYTIEQNDASIPDFTPIEDIYVPNDAFVTYILCDTVSYEKMYNNRTVKKNLVC